MAQNPHEKFDIVDPSDNVIGVRSRIDVHAQGLLHRAVHIFVLNKRGEILLQQRSLKKDSAPGKWTTSCSGHVDSGETYDTASIRELQEELGIDVADPENVKPLFKMPASPATDNEFIWLYELLYDESITYNREEIADVCLLLPSEINGWVSRDPGDFASSFVTVWKQVRSHFGLSH